MNMKKNLIPLFALFALTSCGNQGGTTSESPTTSETPTTSEAVTSEAPSSEETTVEPSSEATISYSEGDYYYEYYSNPVAVYDQTGEYETEIADPTVVRDPESGFFYCVSTLGRLLKSEDGCTWTLALSQIIERPSWGDDLLPSGSNTPSLWAPDLVYIGGQWVCYYSLSGWDSPVGIGYATADSIEGPYTDQGKFVTLDEIGIGNCIDPFVFIDDDGKVYMGAGSFMGIALWELTEDGLACLNGVEYAKENKVWIGGRESTYWDGTEYEGGYIFKKDGYYYFMGSAGTCCSGASSTYTVYVGRSTDIYGPYEDADGNDMAESGGGTTYGNLVIEGKSEVYGPGHNSVIVDDYGQYWIYYHAYTSVDNYATRHLMMDRLYFDEDGYPYVEGQVPSFQEELPGPYIL